MLHGWIADFDCWTFFGLCDDIIMATTMTIGTSRVQKVYESQRGRLEIRWDRLVRCLDTQKIERLFCGYSLVHLFGLRCGLETHKINDETSVA